MPRVILSTAAVAAVLSTVAFTVATGFVALATSALACDCTNCSAQHCQPKRREAERWNTNGRWRRV
jgi:hypothetical protein